MKKALVSVIAVAFAIGTAYAQNGNPCPGEKAYQFNIIGVPKGKTADMTGNNGHRMFVNLTGNSKIKMTGDTDPATEGLQCGDSFQVLDANATSGDDSEGLLLVPCENVNADSTNPGVCFDVWATALGTPGGHVDVDIVCEFDDSVVDTNIDDGDCAQDGIDFDLTRNSGKPVQEDITNSLRASGCFDTDGSGTCDPGEKTFNNIWIFNLEALLEYYWDYDNNGLRVAQIRFCDSDDCGSISFCGDGTVDSNEECDDANTDNGDGCSSTCTIELVEG